MDYNTPLVSSPSAASSSGVRRRHSMLASGTGTQQWQQQQVEYEAQYGSPASQPSQQQQQQQQQQQARSPPRPQQRTRVSQLPHGWIQYWCPIEQTYYYYHPTTDHSTWEKPAQVSSSELPGEAVFRRKRFRLLCEMGVSRTKR